MAVWVYKENEEPELIDALMLPAAIAGGWSVNEGEEPVTEAEIEAIKNINTEEETTSNPVITEEDLLRAKAKAAGIKSWHVKSVAKLQEDLDALNAD